MSSLSLYRQFDRHRQTRGPGPAIVPHAPADTVLMRFAVPVVDRARRVRERGKSVRKTAYHGHNGRQAEFAFAFERDAQKREVEHQQTERTALGDQLKAALEAFQRLSERLGNEA